MKYNMYKWRKVFIWKKTQCFDAGTDITDGYEVYNGDYHMAWLQFVEVKCSKFGGQHYRLIK